MLTECVCLKLESSDFRLFTEVLSSLALVFTLVGMTLEQGGGEERGEGERVESEG